MTSVPPESIIYGVDYAVRAVNGRPPQRDGDFDGEISLSLVYSSGGSAIHHEQSVWPRAVCGALLELGTRAHRRILQDEPRYRPPDRSAVPRGRSS